MILSIANQKGGVGKTDLAVNLSSQLARKGKSVLLIDLDPQANATDYLTTDRFKIDICDLLLADSSLEDVAVKSQIENLELVPGSHKLASAKVQLLNELDMQFKLKSKLKSNKYDYVVIDTQPSLDILTINALVASHKVMIPIQVNYFSLAGVNNLLNTINSIKKGLNQNLSILGMVLTMYDRRNKLSNEVEELVKKSFEKDVFKTAIPINVKLAEAPSHHKPIDLYASWSSGAKAYGKLADEFLRRTEYDKATWK